MVKVSHYALMRLLQIADNQSFHCHRSLRQSLDSSFAERAGPSCAPPMDARRSFHARRLPSTAHH